MGAERRKHVRLALKDRVFITFRPLFDRIGWITDISKGGVSLEYSTIEEYPALTEMLTVDIFSSPRKIELTSLPCRLVYDDRVDNGNDFLGTIETRRCGLVFGELLQHQAAQIEVILNQVESTQ
jgi:hypothetical protein